MRKPPPLTAEQHSAIALAKRQGGKLHRIPVGWGPEEFDVRTTSFDDIFGNSTVKALVSRGAMRWSLWDRGRGGAFPIEAEVVEVSA